ncbi:MAG: hypothetical protein ACOYYS_04565 [Chloroflexota bacterium]
MGRIVYLVGLTEMFKFMPDGTDAIGIGLILLGLNAARYFNGEVVSGFTSTLGTLALSWVAVCACNRRQAISHLSTRNFIHTKGLCYEGLDHICSPGSQVVLPRHS